MSGIFGVFFRDGRPAEPELLERMRERLAHRGPDGSGIWCEGSVGLGHLMLHTTPESLHEALPYVSANGDYVVTADARIDNREELLHLLDRDGDPLPDGELILAAYKRWEEACVDRLLGDFAFAIWDRRRQALFCARDHMGVRPFYYYLSNELFAFASEIRVLLCLNDVPKRLNEDRLADYLTQTFDNQSTLYRGICRLPPAHSLTVTPDHVRERAYWTLEPTREVRLGSDHECAMAFLELFRESVRSRLRSAMPVGSFLSGGLDSSAITCVARNLLATSGNSHLLHTFSAVYDEVPSCDEREYIASVVAQGGLLPHYAPGEAWGPLTDWEEQSWQGDEPLWNISLGVQWPLYCIAREQNVRILMDGFGGDQVVSHGFGYLADLLRQGRWTRWLLDSLRLSQNFDVPVTYFLLQQGLYPLLPQQLRSLGRTILRRSRNDSALELFRPDFAERANLARRRQDGQSAPSDLTSISRREHWAQLVSPRGVMALEVANRGSAMFHIDTVFPFYDRRLVEFCLSLPPQQQIQGGWTRMILRRAMAGILPENVQWRLGKADHSEGYNHAMYTLNGQVLRDTIRLDGSPLEEVVDMTVVRAMYDRYRTDANIHDGMMLWRVAMLSRWLYRTQLKPNDTPVLRMRHAPNKPTNTWHERRMDSP